MTYDPVEEFAAAQDIEAAANELSNDPKDIDYANLLLHQAQTVYSSIQAYYAMPKGVQARIDEDAVENNPALFTAIDQWAQSKTDTDNPNWEGYSDAKIEVLDLIAPYRKGQS
jgi:hypothetical protein